LATLAGRPTTFDISGDYEEPVDKLCERDLIRLFQKVGFAEIHLQLHIDIGKTIALPWDTFIDTAPRPGAPTLRELFSSNFSDTEQRQFEDGLRAQVESGQLMERNTIAYLTARKPG
jgi:arsenite methyltransferase